MEVYKSEPIKYEPQAVNTCGPSSKIKGRLIQLGWLLNEQDEKYGTDMFESLTEDDAPDLFSLIKKGFNREEAALKLFERKYGPVDLAAMPTHDIFASQKNTAINSPSTTTPATKFKSNPLVSASESSAKRSPRTDIALSSMLDDSPSGEQQLERTEEQLEEDPRTAGNDHQISLTMQHDQLNSCGKVSGAHTPSIEYQKIYPGQRTQKKIRQRAEAEGETAQHSNTSAADGGASKPEQAVAVVSGVSVKGLPVEAVVRVTGSKKRVVSTPSPGNGRRYSGDTDQDAAAADDDGEGAPDIFHGAGAGAAIGIPITTATIHTPASYSTQPRGSVQHRDGACLVDDYNNSTDTGGDGDECAINMKMGVAPDESEQDPLEASRAFFARRTSDDDLHARQHSQLVEEEHRLRRWQHDKQRHELHEDHSHGHPTLLGTPVSPSALQTNPSILPRANSQRNNNTKNNKNMGQRREEELTEEDDDANARGWAFHGAKQVSLDFTDEGHCFHKQLSGNSGNSAPTDGEESDREGDGGDGRGHNNSHPAPLSYQYSSYQQRYLPHEQRGLGHPPTNGFQIPSYGSEPHHPTPHEHPRYQGRHQYHKDHIAALLLSSVDNDYDNNDVPQFDVGPGPTDIALPNSRIPFSATYHRSPQPSPPPSGYHQYPHQQQQPYLFVAPPAPAPEHSMLYHRCLLERYQQQQQHMRHHHKHHKHHKDAHKSAHEQGVHPASVQVSALPPPHPVDRTVPVQGAPTGPEQIPDQDATSAQAAEEAAGADRESGAEAGLGGTVEGKMDQVVDNSGRENGVDLLIHRSGSSLADSSESDSISASERSARSNRSIPQLPAAPPLFFYPPLIPGPKGPYPAGVTFEHLTVLGSMGFKEDDVADALYRYADNIPAAANYLYEVAGAQNAAADAATQSARKGAPNGFGTDEGETVVGDVETGDAKSDASAKTTSSANTAKSVDCHVNVDAHFGSSAPAVARGGVGLSPRGFSGGGGGAIESPRDYNNTPRSSGCDSDVAVNGELQDYDIEALGSAERRMPGRRLGGSTTTATGSGSARRAIADLLDDDEDDDNVVGGELDGFHNQQQNQYQYQYHSRHDDDDDDDDEEEEELDAECRMPDRFGSHTHSSDVADSLPVGAPLSTIAEIIEEEDNHSHLSDVVALDIREIDSDDNDDDDDDDHDHESEGKEV